MTQAEICDRLRQQHRVDMSVSALSHNINRGTLRLQRALQILAVCGADEVWIKQQHLIGSRPLAFPNRQA